MASEFEVRRLEVAEYPTWNSLVDASPHGTVFHKTFWLEASGKEFYIYGCFKNAELCGGLPISVQSSFLASIAGHPALTPYLGVVVAPRQAKNVTNLGRTKAIGRAIASAVKKDFVHVRFNFSPAFVDMQPFIWEGFDASVRYTYRIDVSDLDSAWKSLDARKRNGIQRAEKDGIIVDSTGRFEETLQLVEKTFQRQRRSITFGAEAIRYNEQMEKLRQCQSFVARDNRGLGIAAIYIIWDSNRVYHLLGGYDDHSGSRGAQSLLMWKAIQFTNETLRLREFDTEGSMIQGVEAFYREFGGILTPYYSVSWIRPWYKALLALRWVLSRLLRVMKIKER